ncbi:MAG: nucleotidyltransferase domain-containing protein [Armatimonadota bacterium]|jgi:predicted nucleotidyltransferase
MAQRKIGLDQLIEEVREYMRRVGVRDAVLFGSRARNEHVEDSDVDLILVGERFRGTPWLERLPPLYEAWTLPFYPELLPYTPEEFEKRQQDSSVVGEAIEQGIRIREGSDD